MRAITSTSDLPLPLVLRMAHRGRRAARLTSTFRLPLPLILGHAVLLLAGGGWAGAASPQRLDPARVQREVERYVEAELKESGDAWHVERVTVAGDVNLPEGPLRLTLTRGRGVELAGTVVLNLKVEAAGGVVRRLRVTATLDRRHPVWVAATDLARGAVLDEASLRLATVGWSGALRDAVSRKEEVLGMQLVRAVRAGEVVRTQQLRVVEVVHRGDRVTLVAQRGPLQVKASGVARDSAGRNQRVEVANATSGKVVTGTVIDGSTVEVAF